MYPGAARAAAKEARKTNCAHKTCRIKNKQILSEHCRNKQVVDQHFSHIRSDFGSSKFGKKKKPLTCFSSVGCVCHTDLKSSSSWRYNSGRVLVFSTVPFHLRRSWTCSVHFISFVFFRSFLTSSSHRDLGLPTGLPVNDFHLCIFFTILVSGILFMCPNQLNLWALT